MGLEKTFRIGEMSSVLSLAGETLTKSSDNFFSIIDTGNVTEDSIEKIKKLK